MPRLESCFDFDESLLNNLRRIKVYSVLDFISVDSEKLSSFLSPKDYLTLKHKLINRSSKYSETGLSRYKLCLKKSAVLPSQINCLDELLNGGFVTGNLYEITGLSGTGKTQVCMSIVAGVVSKLKRKVFYIDSKFDFSALRVHSILTEQKFKVEEINTFMERINVIRVTSLYDILNVLYDIRDSLQKSGKYDLRLLILDSLTAPFLEFIGSQCSNEGFGLLMEIGSVLKIIANEMHLAVIVTNLAVRYTDNDVDSGLEDIEQGCEEKIRPAMGKAWSHIPHTRLFLQRVLTNDRHVQLSIMKSNNCPINKSSLFTITSQGVAEINC